MGMMRNIVLLGIILIFISINFSGCISEKQEINATLNPFLWKIEGEHPSYLFGTFHDPDLNIITLPSVVLDVINKIDTIYTEMDISNISYNESMNFAQKYVFFEDNKTVYNFLPNETIGRAYQLVENNPVVNWENLIRFKIGWFASMIDSFAYSNNNTNAYPTLETYLIYLTTIRGKISQSIENMDEYASIRNSMTKDEQNQYLNEVISFHENHTLNIKKWREAYIEGDQGKIINLTRTSYGDIYYQYLVVKRNNYMRDRIKDIILNNPNKQYLFAVGAGHVGGEDGLIKLLEDEGFKISRVELNESENNPRFIKINGKSYEPYNKEKLQNIENDYSNGLQEAKAGRYNQALSYFQQTVELEPQHAKAWYYLGLCYTYLKQYDKTIEPYQKATEIYPNYINAWSNLGYSYYLMNNLNSSIESYNRALEIDPTLATTWLSLGYVYRDLGRDNESKNAFQRAHELDPTLTIP
jgi:uncharacterized protein